MVISIRRALKLLLIIGIQAVNLFAYANDNVTGNIFEQIEVPDIAFKEVKIEDYKGEQLSQLPIEGVYYLRMSIDSEPSANEAITLENFKELFEGVIELYKGNELIETFNIHDIESYLSGSKPLSLAQVSYKLSSLDKGEYLFSP